MRITLKNRNCVLMEDFPKNPLELLDILERLHQTGNRMVNFEFYCYYEKVTLPPELTEWEFRADIFTLNVFTERLIDMTPTERAVYQAVLQKNPVLRFEDALQMTFGLESVPVVKSSCFSKLGKFFLENEMLSEVQDCPDEFLKLLDMAKLGRLMTERNNGVFIGDYYCEPETYEKPDIQIEISDPKPCVFRLLLTPDADRPELAGWIFLPCDNAVLENKVCLKHQSSLPNLLISRRPKQEELNRTAELLTGLNPQEFVKLKAVMKATEVRNIAGVFDCFSHLSEYDFDSAPQNKSEYGMLFLKKVLPPDFCESFKGADLTDFGDEILRHKHNRMMSYGALISEILEHNADQIATKENYVGYLAKRMHR